MLYDTWDGCYCGGKVADFLCVWNPATREYKKIPHSPNSPNAFLQGDVCIHGLSYYGKNEDYKFVIGACSDKSGLTTLVEVFSVRSNSWKTIETPYRFTYDEQKSGVLINGDLHWLAKTEHGVCIVYLDSSSDFPSFKEIQLPRIPNLEFVSVGVLEEGRLCVVVDNGGHVGLGRVEVWELKVYGVPESWTKRHVISNETITQAVVNKTFAFKSSVMKIIWSFKNGNIVFLCSDDVVLYDPKHGTAIERNLERFAAFDSEVNYVESLVSIHTLKWGTELLEESTEDESTEDELTEDEST
ncbi:F-box protein At4g22390-like [Papaver somniferum]|uniref:F-box protein At4g22390-like n=1 Tax=Papaver somniferum TaxID=3469 RepID=UPI000E700FAC|nr:F-box protein At4g22390-like [Papaver somniferum]XP_026418370.1 F-box protein At4g22390-like [Papaver somniferum]XP_026418371.1 F-box protein At4g22390-like [Papaver somniferum]